MLLTCPQCGSDALIEQQAEDSHGYETHCLACGYTQPIDFKKRNRIPVKQLINYQF